MKINYSTNTVECRSEDELKTFIYMLEPRVIYQIRFNPPFGTDGGTGGRIIRYIHNHDNHFVWLKDPIEGAVDWQIGLEGDVDSSEFFYKVNDGLWRDPREELTDRFIEGEFELFGEVFPVSKNKFLHTDKQIPGYVYFGYGIDREKEINVGWFLTLKPLTPYHKKVYINIEDALQDFENFDLSTSGYIGRSCCEPTLRPEVGSGSRFDRKKK